MFRFFGVPGISFFGEAPARRFFRGFVRLFLLARIRSHPRGSPSLAVHDFGSSIFDHRSTINDKPYTFYGHRTHCHAQSRVRLTFRGIRQHKRTSPCLCAVCPFSACGVLWRSPISATPILFCLCSQRLLALALIKKSEFLAEYRQANFWPKILQVKFFPKNFSTPKFPVPK